MALALNSISLELLFKQVSLMLCSAWGSLGRMPEEPEGLRESIGQAWFGRNDSIQNQTNLSQ
jgi:hypothetical protein